MSLNNQSIQKKMIVTQESTRESVDLEEYKKKVFQEILANEEVRKALKLLSKI
ncbi:hypothetical protein G6R29_02615 [Fructobacillus sp. M2-14]|uniref:Uncharacterized protein n=1 Tax=Fructobacillus broussonetiae TaxID=2713173 RepID=A0ABS5QZC5_9LACO|nr:hypothetical protein [Fructobacillus broussonetiae]MBS9338529.1 hypothetical protein [Fructobacillus broussonetiae]